MTADTNVKTEPFEFAGSGLEDGTGYGALWLNAKWTVAGLNGAPRFDAGGLSLTTGRQEAK